MSPFVLLSAPSSLAADRLPPLRNSPGMQDMIYEFQHRRLLCMEVLMSAAFFHTDVHALVAA